MSDSNLWEAGEPTLDELLSDPIMDFILRRDRLTRRDIWRAVDGARDNLRAERVVEHAAA
jgi:hypothetical protein